MKEGRSLDGGVRIAIVFVIMVVVVIAAVASAMYFESSTIHTSSTQSPTGLGTIELGPVAPWTDAYDSGKGEVFVANANNNSVSVISDATNRVVATITVGHDPVGLAYDRAKGEVFVANYNCDSANPCEAGTVSVISDLTNSVIATIQGGLWPNSIVYDPAKGELFITDQGSDSVLVISDATNSIIANVTVSNQPYGLAYDPVKGEVFVANDGSDVVSVISDSTNAVVANITVAVGLTYISYDSTDGELFVPTSLGYIAVLSDSTNSVVGKVTLEAGSNGITYDSGKNEVYVSDYLATGADTVSVISAADRSVIANVTVGCGPNGLAYDQTKNEIFVADLSSGTISVMPDDLSGMNITNSITSCPSSSSSTQSSYTQLGNLQLNVKTNASALVEGNNLGIAISLNNIASVPLNISAGSDWTVPGFPIALFPGCLGTEPVEFMIVRGNLSLNDLRQASANTSIFDGGCMEGGFVRYVLFRPDSSLANLTGDFCTANCYPKTSTYSLTTNFTVSGYWAYPVNSSEAYDVETPAPGCHGCTTFNYPEVGPIAQHDFIAGTYTLVVSDERGQTVVIHFQVQSSVTEL